MQMIVKSYYFGKRILFQKGLKMSNEEMKQLVMDMMNMIYDMRKIIDTLNCRCTIDKECKVCAALIESRQLIKRAKNFFHQQMEIK